MPAVVKVLTSESVMWFVGGIALLLMLVSVYVGYLDLKNTIENRRKEKAEKAREAELQRQKEETEKAMVESQIAELRQQKETAEQIAAKAKEAESLQQKETERVCQENSELEKENKKLKNDLASSRKMIISLTRRMRQIMGCIATRSTAGFTKNRAARFSEGINEQRRISGSSALAARKRIEEDESDATLGIAISRARR